MLLLRGETDAEQGFKDGLRELGYSVRYRTVNAGRDQSEFARSLRVELTPQCTMF